MAKRKTVMIGKVPYTMTDLKQSLRAANIEARGYLDQLGPLRRENQQLRAQVDMYERARTIILSLLGVKNA